MAVTTPIPVTDLSGQQTVALPRTTQAWQSAQITVNRSGSGGTHPWLNSLTPTDTLSIAFEWSADGTAWNDLGTDTLTGGSFVLKGVVVPQTNTIQVGIGRVFPAGTFFRVILDASTPLTFSGTAIYQ